MRCARCDAELAAGTVQGLCPVCLLDAALPNDSWEADDSFRYDLIEEIARGGMGVVYRAIQHGSQRQVAVKMILAEQAATGGMMERFRAEAEAVASLDHPNILPIYEMGEHDGQPFYSMKFARGGTLRERLADFKAPAAAAQLIAMIARAVDHAHGRGILHRDLKPGNILLDGAEGTPYVADFGLAKWLGRDNRLTIAPSALGTPHYIAPEQAAGASKDLTAAADVYSLGAILYELLAGRPPFVADTALETLRLARDAAPAPLRSLHPTIPRDLEVICLKCLAKEPAARYASAAALADDLERWRQGQTILARPATSIERAWSWTKRNRALAGLSGALLSALVLLVIGLPGTRRASRTASIAPEKSIAVLPFQDLSKDEENAFFADGVQDQILTDLAKIADLKVISRTSVMQYKNAATRSLREIAQQLGVVHVVEGSVQRAGGKVRVTAQLINALTDAHEWAENYDRPVDDVFAIQSEIAKKIADQLQATISPREKEAMSQSPTANLAAYDFYIRAAALIDQAAFMSGKAQEKDLFQAVELLNQAIALDPAFLLAYCRLAEAHDELYFQTHDHTPARLALANSAIDAAFHLKPDSGEAHLARATHFYHGYFDYDHARDELAIAVRTLPNNARIFEWTGYIDRRQGRWHDAARNLQRAGELDPRNVRILTSAAATHRLMRDYRQARETFDRLIALEPNNNRLVFRALIDVAERADTRAVHAVIEKILRDDPASAGNLVGWRLYLALWEHDPAAADRALAALTENTIGTRNTVT